MKLKTADDESRATLKILEAAKIAGVGARSIYKGVADGTIPHLRFGRSILIPRAAFLRWLDSCGGAVPAGVENPVTGVESSSAGGLA